MLSRVTTRVILHSAKNCTSIGPLPSKFRALLSGTPDQQNYEFDKPIAGPPIPPFQSYNASEAIKIAVEQEPLESETTGQIRKIISQIPHLFSDGTIPAPRMTEFTLHRFNDLAIRRTVKIEPLKGLDDCSICSLDDLVRSKSFQIVDDHDNFEDSNCCISPTILQLLRDVASELAVLHEWEIVYGDINPQNISILQGQRLFARLVNCDHKALEWLRRGSETNPAADMFSLGRVISFCISEGCYPVGDILAQSHKDILEKKINLTRAKYLPEAFHLICALLMKPHDRRFDALHVLNHPLFWSPKKRVTFLYYMTRRMLGGIYCYADPQSRAWNCSLSRYIMDETWEEEIGSVRLSCTSYEGLQKSLLYLKDMNVFHMAVPNLWDPPLHDFEPFNDTEAQLYRIVDDYYARRYPWLLIYLYLISYRAGGFRRFYPRSGGYVLF